MAGPQVPRMPRHPRAGEHPSFPVHPWQVCPLDHASHNPAGPSSPCSTQEGCLQGLTLRNRPRPKHLSSEAWRRIRSLRGAFILMAQICSLRGPFILMAQDMTCTLCRWEAASPSPAQLARESHRCVCSQMVHPCDPTDCSQPGSSVHGLSQTRILEWVSLL